MRRVLSLLVILAGALMIFAATQPKALGMLENFILEKTPFEVTGTIKEVVYRPAGFGYIVVSTEATEVKIPFTGNLGALLKPEEKLVLKGSKITAFVPLSLEAKGYKLVFRNIVPKNVQLTEVKAKIKKILVSRTSVEILIVDENSKEYKLPASVVPFWKSLKEGDDVKITGFTRTFEVNESITIGGKTYLLSAKELMTRLEHRPNLFKQGYIAKFFKQRR